MYNFRITCDNGAVNFVRARKRETAMMLFCKAEGCSVEWFCKHCTMIKMREVKENESKDTESLSESSKSQRDKLQEYTKDVAYEAAQLQLASLVQPILEAYIKMSCLVLHDAFGFGEKRLRMYVGNHRRLFAKQYKLVMGNQQNEYLDKRMAEIFRKDGFPQEFVNNLIGKVEVVEE